MCLLNLIKQDNAVWFTTNSLCKLTAFFVSYISRRRSDQTRYRIFLHVLTHIDSYHILLIIKQSGCQCLGKFCLTNTGRSKEQERSNRFGRVFDSCFGTKDCICNKTYTFILSDHTFMQFILQTKKFRSLAFSQFRYRNTCPTGDNPCNLIICDSFMYQTAVTFFDLFFFDFQLLLSLRKFSVLQFCCFFQIVILFCFLDLFIDVINLLT